MKNVLIITYYWPPCGGVGAQRWLRISKYLSQFGWNPTIITTENGDYPFYDVSLSDYVTNDIQVIRTKTPTFRGVFSFFSGQKEIPYGSLISSKDDTLVKRLMLFLRAQLVVPDMRVIWNRHAFIAAEKEVLKGKYQAIITTGPPHSTHLVGLKLRKKYNIRWLVDMRDPWTNIYYYQSTNRNRLISYLDKTLEKKVINYADKIVTVSNDIAKSLNNKKVHIISNAFDPIDYIDYTYQRTNAFRIKFVGNLNQSRKGDILRIIKCLDDLCTANKIDIEFSIIGSEIDLSHELKLKRVSLRNTGFINHHKVIEECVNSELLLLLINKTSNNKGILTYKLFEYLGSKTKIIGVGPVKGDAAEILRLAKAGEMFEYSDIEGFNQFVLNNYHQWNEKEIARNANDINQYSMPHITEMFTKLLDEFLNGGF